MPAIPLPHPRLQLQRRPLSKVTCEQKADECTWHPRRRSTDQMPGSSGQQPDGWCRPNRDQSGSSLPGGNNQGGRNLHSRTHRRRAPKSWVKTPCHRDSRFPRGRHSAGVARAVSICLALGWRGHGAGVARAWRGHGAGVARAWRGRGAGVARA
eukprot:gene14246-biopygen11137